MSGFFLFALGLVVGWLACKMMAGSSAESGATPVAAIPAPAPAPAATPSAPVPAAAPVAAANPPAGTPSAGGEAVTEQLHAARGEINSQKAEIKRLETELDAARRNLLAARHSASNHGSTIAALRDQVSGLQAELKAAQEAARKSA